jgi:hypothetical protein
MPASEAPNVELSARYRLSHGADALERLKRGAGGAIQADSRKANPGG